MTPTKTNKGGWIGIRVREQNLPRTARQEGVVAQIGVPPAERVTEDEDESVMQASTDDADACSPDGEADC
jgi:hypothetical protein